MNKGSAASLQDNSSHGEDAYLSRDLSEGSVLDAVLDGVTHCEGAYASGFAAQMLREAEVVDLDSLLDVLRQTNRTLFKGGLGRKLLTTVSVGLICGQELHVVHSGDSPVYLLRDGRARELTDTPLRREVDSLVGGALGLNEDLSYGYNHVSVKSGDGLVLATDGLMSNVYTHELEEIISGSPSPVEAIKHLEALVGRKRAQHVGREDTYGTFRVDDLTAIIRYFA